MSFSVITLSSSDDEEMSVFSPAPSSLSSRKASTTTTAAAPASVRSCSRINLPPGTTITSNGTSAAVADTNLNIVLPRDRRLLTSYISPESKPGPRLPKGLSCTLINGGVSSGLTVEKGKSARKSFGGSNNNSKNHVTIKKVNNVDSNQNIAIKSVSGSVKKTVVVTQSKSQHKGKEKDTRCGGEKKKVSGSSSSKAHVTNHVTSKSVKKDARNKVSMKSKMSGNPSEKTAINHVAKNESSAQSDVKTETTKPKVKKDEMPKPAVKATSCNSGATNTGTDHVVPQETKKDLEQSSTKVEETKVKPSATSDEVSQEIKMDCVSGEESNACAFDASRTKEVVKRATARKRTSFVDPPPAKKPRPPPICGRKLFNRFLSFISTRLKVSAEEETRILNRLEHSFNETDLEFVESKDFYYLILGTVKKIKANVTLLYMYIEDVRQELRFRDRRHGETGATDEVKTEEEPGPSTSSASSEPKPSTSVEGSVEPVPSTSVTETLVKSEDQREQDSKRIRLIEKLKEFLRRLDRRIQKLQNRELDLNDLEKEDSAYLREASLKRKFMKTWDLICKLENCSTSAGREVHKKYRYSGTIYQDINKEVEKLVNKQRIFPNFCDILDIIQSYCERTRLAMTPSQKQKLAEEVFSNVGNDLKNRRIRDDQDTLGSYLLCGSETFDPADADETLKKLLEESAVEGEKKIQNVIDHFASRQIELKLEPVEGQEDHSSRDSDEEDNEDEEEEELDIESAECSSDSSSESDVLSDQEMPSLKKEEDASFNQEMPSLKKEEDASSNQELLSPKKEEEEEEEKKDQASPRTLCPPSSSSVDCIVLSD